jgi:hypothetical protein
MVPDGVYLFKYSVGVSYFVRCRFSFRNIVITYTLLTFDIVIFSNTNIFTRTLPVVADPRDLRFKPCVCGRSLAGTEGSNPAGGMDISCEFCVLSGRESHRVWCV